MRQIWRRKGGKSANVASLTPISFSTPLSLGHCSFHPSIQSPSLTVTSFTFVAGFDDYFTSLRPPLKLSHCQASRPPSQQKSPTGQTTRLNCRNPWFRQFWHALQLEGQWPYRPASKEKAMTNRPMILSDFNFLGIYIKKAKKY